MSTIRGWLDEAGFHWDAGRIIHHDTGDEAYPGWSQSEVVARREITHDDQILDKAFDSGYGGPKCPCFVAYDDRAVYFPNQYDGSTDLTVVMLDPAAYLAPDSVTPYPGG